MNNLFGWNVALGIAFFSGVLVLLVMFGKKFASKVWHFNKKHHLIAFNDNSVDKLYAWDEDDDF